MGIKEFYDGCDIFITGGSGFMGKVLIEKLLRSCPGINHVYVLMRHRKDKNITTRVNDMLALPLFDKIKTEHPGRVEDKLVPVLGDLSEIRLGLSDDDYDMLTKKVSVVFHVAATVRFDEPLQDAIIKNVRGTREVVRLAKQMEALKVFLHVSTTYCNCNRVYVEERIYDPPMKWQDAIAIAENLDPKIAEICSTNFLGAFPNTYTLTKLLAEQVINEEAINNCSNNNMPLLIFRPSIVISSVEEPVVGWIDNVNGPIGLMVACGKGVVNVTLAAKDTSPDFMAVDLSIKAMIVAAYHRGTHNSISDEKLPVYNSSSKRTETNNKTLLGLSVKYFMSHPFDEILWRPSFFITGSKFLFSFLTVTQQVIPAILIDCLLKATGTPTKVNLVKLQQKIYLASMGLSHFTLQTWTFVNTKFLGLLKHIPDDEKKDFDFRFDHYDSEVVFRGCLIGTQKYLFNTNPEKKIQTLKKLNKLVWIDRLLKTVLFLFFTWCLFKLNILPRVNYLF